MRIELNTTNWDDFLVINPHGDRFDLYEIINSLMKKHNALVEELKLQDQIQTAVTGGDIKEYNSLKYKRDNIDLKECNRLLDIINLSADDLYGFIHHENRKDCYERLKKAHDLLFNLLNKKV